jgi:hypothetical protein
MCVRVHVCVFACVFVCVGVWMCVCGWVRNAGRWVHGRGGVHGSGGAWWVHGRVGWVYGFASNEFILFVLGFSGSSNPPYKHHHISCCFGNCPWIGGGHRWFTGLWSHTRGDEWLIESHMVVRCWAFGVGNAVCSASWCIAGRRAHRLHQPRERHFTYIYIYIYI